MQDGVFAALLVIDDELHRYPRSPRPTRIWRIAAIADEIAGVILRGLRGLHRLGVLVINSVGTRSGPLL
jgi:hypothetical protein